MTLAVGAGVIPIDTRAIHRRFRAVVRRALRRTQRQEREAWARAMATPIPETEGKWRRPRGNYTSMVPHLE